MRSAIRTAAIAALCAVLADAVPARAQSAGSHERMDYGPVIGATVRCDWPAGNTARKGIAIRLDHDAAVIFDTQMLRYAAVTVGGWVDISKTDLAAPKGSDTAATAGRQTLGTPQRPGWAHDGRFDDPRERPYGPLPASWATYRGYWKHGERVVLDYTVGGVPVRDMPAAVRASDHVALVRTLRIGPSDEPMRMVAAQTRQSGRPIKTGEGVGLRTDRGRTLAALIDGTSAAGLRLVEGDRIELRVQPHEKPMTLRLVLGLAPPEAPSDVVTRWKRAAGEPADLSDLTAGGPAQWPERLRRAGRRADSDDAYVKDTIPLPMDNPWDAVVRPSGFDFFQSDPTRGALCTYHGDVWLFSGLGDGLESVTWKRFASGLFRPLGLEIRDGEIFTIGRGQLTRLKDLNGDGEADFYGCFYNGVPIHPRSHTAGLKADSEGRFYFAKNGNRAPPEVPDHGAIIRVEADGSGHRVYANGLRGSNGLAFGPGDQLASTDQQGTWVPTTRFDLIEPGGFYGYRPHGGKGRPEGRFDGPVCWVPYNVDNSSAAPVYAGDRRFGPLADRWHYVSYGRAKVFTVLTQTVGGTRQGGVFRLPMSFDSGLMRARINPRDGQLYVLGMRAWGTGVPEPACFNRIRYTGRDAHLPVVLRALPDGVALTFSAPLKESAATDADNYTVRRWRYKYWDQYGSPEFSVARPEKKQRDAVNVAAATLRNGGRTVVLRIPEIRPVMQQMVRYGLSSRDGQPVQGAIYHTIDKLPPAE